MSVSVSVISRTVNDGTCVPLVSAKKWEKNGVAAFVYVCLLNCAADVQCVMSNDTYDQLLHKCDL